MRRNQLSKLGLRIVIAVGINQSLLMSTAFIIATSAVADINKTGSINTLAPGYGALKFAAPKPGTYKLPVLGKASDGNVIDSNGEATSLFRLMEHNNQPGKVVLLSFIYTTCSDINGCPLATAVFQKIKNHLTQEPAITNGLRLLTISFNPQHDTPERMREYGANLQGKGIDWQFLTTTSEQTLTPILQAYQQSAVKVFDADGHFTNTFNHSLRVYLIDQHQQIRNIYNSELLHPDTVIADIKTLLLQSNNDYIAVNSANDKKLINKSQLYSPGDNKINYQTTAYKTQSIALSDRQGKAADLLKSIRQPPLGLSQVPIPVNNPITPEKIALGRKLFYDRRLSINNTFSCAMCHIPEQGFTSNEMATAVGVEGRTVRRNSPTLYNVAYMQALFHDGRESTLENQIWGPFLAHNEMANPSVGYVIEKINSNADYNGLFEQAFGKPASIETIGMAIASYECTLNSANSPFDRWYFGKDKNALDAKAQHGLQLFTGKAGCSQCHIIDKEYALFTDNKLHNTGIGYADAMHKPAAKTQKIQVSPGVYVDVASDIINSVAEPKVNDLGRYEVTQNPQDRWHYKTPSLRNVSLTAPYMHNGSLTSLREVVEFYNRGGIPNENLDPLIKPLKLTDDEIAELTAFLEALTGDNVEELVGDAFAAPSSGRN